MDFNIELDFAIFKTFLEKRPEVNTDTLKKDLQRYYLPYIQKLINLKKKKDLNKGLIVGISAIQGAGKTTQGEILEILIKHFNYSSISTSIDNYYITHEQLNELREYDPRYIRRGVTHDVYLAIQDLKALQDMKDGMEVRVPIYDKGAKNGDGDWIGWQTVTKKCDFIFFDGWMLGAKKVEDESIFDSGLPALDSPEHIQFAKDVNKKLDEYKPLWELIDFTNVLYVPNYQISLVWRDQAEDILRIKREGMTHEQIREFVYYFWRSVHPAIFIKNLILDDKTDQIVVINDDHTIKEVLTPVEARTLYL